METRFLERPQGRLAYTDYGGAGDLVLMLPGMGALRSEYRYLAPRLRAAGYRAVTADLGDTESPAPSEDHLRDVKAPTLVVMGTKDPDFPDPAAEGRFVAEQTRGALELIDDAGHYPQTELPDETTPRILAFLKRSVTQSPRNTRGAISPS